MRTCTFTGVCYQRFPASVLCTAYIHIHYRLFAHLRGQVGKSRQLCTRVEHTHTLKALETQPDAARRMPQNARWSHVQRIRMYGIILCVVYITEYVLHAYWNIDNVVFLSQHIFLKEMPIKKSSQTHAHPSRWSATARRKKHESSPPRKCDVRSPVSQTTRFLCCVVVRVNAHTYTNRLHNRKYLTNFIAEHQRPMCAAYA